jgi:hypothetical protein
LLGSELSSDRALLKIDSSTVSGCASSAWAWAAAAAPGPPGWADRWSVTSSVPTSADVGGGHQDGDRRDEGTQERPAFERLDPRRWADLGTMAADMGVHDAIPFESMTARDPCSASRDGNRRVAAPPEIMVG